MSETSSAYQDASRDHEPTIGSALEWTPAIGDHVRLKHSEANGWLQPWRKFAQTGRVAVVTSLRQGRVWCEFKPLRRGAQSWRMDFGPSLLEPASSAEGVTAPVERDRSRDDLNSGERTS